MEMQKDVPHVGVVKTGCRGLCERTSYEIGLTIISMCMYRWKTVKWKIGVLLWKVSR
ncbi:MAG: hypothetical protein ACLSF5_03305 [Blautia massiliensis (ex Durand et al. 2017)]